MRPQEPGGPPFRGHGTGGEATRTDASEVPGGRHAHAREDDAPVDPYGDVPGPGPGGAAPYGSSGWSGSERAGGGDAAYGDVPGHGNGYRGEGGYGGYGLSSGYGDVPGNGYSGHGYASNGQVGNGHPPGGNGATDGYPDAYRDAYRDAYGDPATGADGRSAPGPPDAAGRDHAAPAAPVAPPAGPWGSEWGTGRASTPDRPAPPPLPAPPHGPPGGPHPGGRPYGPPPQQGNGHAGRPAPASVPPQATGPAGPPPASPSGPPPARPAGPPSGPDSNPDGASAVEPAPAPSAAPSATGSGLAGADGFASRAPRSREDVPPSSTTATTTAFTGGAGVGPGRHRRAGTGPGRDDEVADEAEGTARSGRRSGDKGGRPGGKQKKKGSFWRELPLLIVVAVVLTFVIQTFLARIYVIPSASMEQTLHGCNGCANDRVAVDKLTYRFSDPAPGDVVVFRGPPTWGANGEVAGDQPSGNVLVRGLQSGLSLIGLAPPDEKDFVKRVVATGGQTVACCDPQNRVTVDGNPLDEPYVYYQPNLGRTQADFAPVRVPEGQLWVMGDNRNNSADARVHGPIGVTDVIGKARVIVLPVGRWGGVPDTDPQARPSALGAPVWTSGAPLAAGVLGAVPLVVVTRRVRRRWTSQGGWSASGSPPSPDPGR